MSLDYRLFYVVSSFHSSLSSNTESWRNLDSELLDLETDFETSSTEPEILFEDPISLVGLWAILC